MTYEVLKAFEDEAYDLKLADGDTFVPASIGYPKDRVNARVLDGSLKLTTKVAPYGDQPIVQRDALATAAPATETCTYCGVEYPAPVSLHHSEQECRDAIASNQTFNPPSVENATSSNTQTFEIPDTATPGHVNDGKL